MTWVNAVIQGILLGGLYALFATGLSLGFGVMRLVNLAHGDLAILAAFFTLSLSDTLDLNPLVALLVVLPCAFMAGLLLQRLVFDRVVGVDPAFQISIGWFPLITLLVAIAVLGLLSLFLYRSRLGRAFRATSDDPETARLMGIGNRQIYAVATGLALVTVALAGVLLGVRGSFDPFAGPVRLIYAFEAVIIGGLGSLWGTLAGGIVLGVAQGIGRQIDPQWGELVGHFVFLAVLALRPTGLFGKAGQR
jgi:branched-chain amino acid transport system permease protein